MFSKFVNLRRNLAVFADEPKTVRWAARKTVDQQFHIDQSLAYPT